MPAAHHWIQCKIAFVTLSQWSNDRTYSEVNISQCIRSEQSVQMPNKRSTDIKNMLAAQPRVGIT